MNRIFFATIALLVACEASSTPSESASVERQQRQYLVAQPLPAFDWSLERDVAIQLYQARNERVATHTVWRSDTGIVEGDCPSIGYPLPYDTSLTNPLQVSYQALDTSSVTEQAEPNGLYSSKNTAATWVRCVVVVNGKDVDAPIYIESKVTAYPFPVAVDYASNRVKPVSGVAPSVVIEAGTPPVKPKAVQQ